MKVKLKPSAPENDDVIVVDYSVRRDGPWSADKLYSLSQGHRRLLVLEMLSSMIAEAERIETRAEWDRFKQKLESERIDARGQRPWPQATDHERFLAHLVSMADTFVTSNPVSSVSQEGRRIQSDHGA